MAERLTSHPQRLVFLQDAACRLKELVQVHCPAGTTARLSLSPGEQAYQLTLSPPAPTGAPGAPGTVTAVLRLDAGLSWPDRQGERIVEAALEEGGPVILDFQSMVDALTCQKRLQRAGVL